MLIVVLNRATFDKCRLLWHMNHIAKLAIKRIIDWKIAHQIGKVIKIAGIPIGAAMVCANGFLWRVGQSGVER